VISDALTFGRLWHIEVNDAIEYAKFRSRSHDAVIRVYDNAGNMIETHKHAAEFKGWCAGETKSRHALKRDG
jgi:hypothetical protein